jgi:molybdate transport system substrate-binding protein
MPVSATLTDADQPTMSSMAREPAAIVGISSMATRHVLAELCALREQQSGERVEVVAVAGIEAARRVADGEPFDFVVLADDVVQRLAQSGHVQGDTRTPMAFSSTAVAVAAGAHVPDVSTESALRDAVMHARTIGYSTGPSGLELMRLFAHWGVADELKPRLVQAPPGVPVGALVAEGRAALGFQQLSELIHVPGIEVLGVLPHGIEIVTLFSAAVCAASARREPARAWLDFLAAPGAAPVMRKHGMEAA